MFLSPNNIKWHCTLVKKEDRCALNRHSSTVIWLTGLPSSGKSTVANQLEHMLFRYGLRSYILDGDNIRHGLNKNLSFTAEDRKENMRRVGEVAKLFIDAGLITIVAFVSPFRTDRQMVRDMFPKDEFLEVFVKCSLAVCELRDPKGLYKKARKGEIAHFTGVNDPYEAPEQPELEIETDKLSLDDCVRKIFRLLVDKKIVTHSDELGNQKSPGSPVQVPDPLLSFG
ncbi:MAG: adenylyl-sulfate kinase [Nitrospirae bacterium GWC2_57_13]|jgi:adenylylsulfate kinase|nr:MAG: adenylyl-sulfate kinase [Nitrospirae bacterium GWC2_57_13]OGW42572.1 MAG: adenylyl-sulfate kinase [Nitrospirae bacterium GWD2_57_8]HAR45457.1 adenylyl-sulfate kinase [Nitrospiraceae bacterium]HAS54712.1 adenylyl-sulfate kinase [Nitrospiraceae bacterium]